MQNLAVNSNSSVGNLYILPTTFVGGPRFMNKLYQDSMAMVRHFGRPDLFITFTCNPKWPEITRELLPWQTATDRPDLISRVFQLKVEEFLRDMVEREIFGTVIAYVYTIEEQKRGLPHLHSLFTLGEDDKIRTAEKIDELVCAEIPDIETNSELHQIILKNNIHGPCGSLNPRSVCMVNGTCSKNFPKPFRDVTDAGVNGYPLYKRSDNMNKNYVIRDLPINNSYVVPFNSYLSSKYNAHINVEICSSVVAVKYIHKYLIAWPCNTKGHDCSRVEIVQNSTTNGSVVHHDEIKHFLNCRYVSPPEAAWRLLENPVHGQSHTIYTLSVYLPEGQMMFFNERQEEEAVRRGATQHTTYTAWFELNVHNVEAGTILYQNIPNFYTFSQKKWIQRKRNGNKVIGRIIAISPRNMELYHMRIYFWSEKGYHHLKIYEQ